MNRLLLIAGTALASITALASATLGASGAPRLVCRGHRCTTTTTAVTTSTAASTTTTTSTVPATTTTIPSGTTIWADEFNGTSVDLNKWQPSWEFGTNISHSSNWPTAIDCWNPAHVAFPGDGAAHLTLTHTACTTGNNETFGWTGAGLESKGKFATPLTAHRVDVRAKLPIGWRSWPAIWSTQTGWPAAGEFDIAEGTGNVPRWHTHWSGTTIDGTIPNPDDGQYHVYSMQVIPGAPCSGGTMVAEVYAFDGGTVGTTNVCLAWNGQYLLLDVDACTQSWCGTPTDGTEMAVDYVRVTAP